MRNTSRKQGRKSVRDAGNNQGSLGNLIALLDTHTPPGPRMRGKLDGSYPEVGLSLRRKWVGHIRRFSVLASELKARSPSPQPHVAALLPSLGVGPWGFESLGKSPRCSPVYQPHVNRLLPSSQPCPTHSRGCSAGLCPQVQAPGPVCGSLASLTQLHFSETSRSGPGAVVVFLQTQARSRSQDGAEPKLSPCQRPPAHAAWAPGVTGWKGRLRGCAWWRGAAGTFLLLGAQPLLLPARPGQ